MPQKKAALLGWVWIVPVGKEGQGSNGRRDVLGSRVNTVISCVWSKHNKKIPTDSDVLQITLPRLDYLLGYGRGGKKNLINLCLWDVVLLPGSVLKVSFHPGGPPYLPHLDFGEWATCRQAPFGSASSHPFPRQAGLSEANSLYLLFKFSGCFSWVLICCLRDYPPSEFVFQTSSIDESCTASFYYVCEGMWLRNSVLLSLHLLCSWADLFFVMQRRGVNNTWPVVGKDVSTALFWARCVRWFTGAPPCGKPVPGSSFEVVWSSRIPASSGMGHPVSGLG